MKKALIIFVILLIFTMLIPMVSVFREKEENKTNEMVTIFASEMVTTL